MQSIVFLLVTVLVVSTYAWTPRGARMGQKMSMKGKKTQTEPGCLMLSWALRTGCLGHSL